MTGTTIHFCAGVQKRECTIRLVLQEKEDINDKPEWAIKTTVPTAYIPWEMTSEQWSRHLSDVMHDCFIEQCKRVSVIHGNGAIEITLTALSVPPEVLSKLAMDFKDTLIRERIPANPNFEVVEKK